MFETAAHNGPTPALAPAEAFRCAVSEQLVELNAQLLRLMREVSLAREPQDGSAGEVVTLSPTARQMHASAALLGALRSWSERVRPFLDRSPTAPTTSFDEAFALLSTYFALRRVGTGISDDLWRELFELESTHIVAHLDALLEQSAECFALLNPRPPKPVEDLAIRFTPLGLGRYLLSGESRQGEAQAEMQLPFEPREVENFILRHCEPLRRPVRGWTAPSMTPYAQFGGRLFDTLFCGQLRDLYVRHAGAVAEGQVSLRVRLRLGHTPELWALPWEFLYDGTDFLALTGSVTLTRHIDANRPVRPVQVHGPLRIAVTVSAPADCAPIDASREVEALTGALAPLVSAGLVRVDVAPDGTIGTLADMLRSAEVAGRPFHVWHFIGHGQHLDREAATYLTFEHANGTSRAHSGFELGTLLCAHPDLRLAVLNACEGARSGPDDSLTSVAAALVTRGLPAAVAMQFPITDAAAIRFGDEFYRALADCGSIEAAVADARRAIFFMPNESEWATPVVLSRSSEGALFDLRRPER